MEKIIFKNVAEDGRRTHAEGAVFQVAIHTDTVIATNGIITVSIRITDVCPKSTFIDI